MTFEEFLKLTYDALKQTEAGYWLTESYLDPKTHESVSQSSYGHGYTFGVTWSKGGTSGNCYDNEPQVKAAEDEPGDVEELDIILEALVPSIGVFQYKQIRRAVIEAHNVHHRDYYGGSTTEGHKGFFIKVLYMELVNHGLLDSSKSV